MNDNQRDKLDSYDRVANFNTLHAAALATIVDYAPEQLIFDASRANIAAAAGVQSTLIGGFADDSETSKNAMAAIVIQYARAGLVKAKRANNMALADSLDQQVTYIAKPAKQTAISRATDIRNALNNNLAICTNVTAANITSIDAAIADYTAKQSQPISQRQVKKATGTDVLPAEFDDADEAVQNMYDLIYSFQPALADEFRLAKEIITTGHHYTGIRVTVALGPAPNNLQQGVTVKVRELNKTALTDINGVALIEKFKPGTYHLDLTGTTIGSKTIIQKIKRGQILDLHFEFPVPI